MVNTRMHAWRATDGLLPLAGTHSLAERTFRLGDVPSVRRLAAEFGTRAGIESARLQDFVLAVSEAAACAVAGGACTARVRLWTTGRRAFCEVQGDGNNSMMWQGPGGVRQDEAEALRRWLLRQLCDHVSVESGHEGVTVLLSMAVI